MSIKQNNKSYLDEIINEVQSEMDEATTTGNVAGYQTPNAFSDNGSNDKKRKKKLATQAGYTLAEGFGADLDIIKKGSKDIVDFIRKVLSDKDYKEVRSDKEFHKYLKSFYNESTINERQLKGLDGIDSKTPLSKISDAQKLKIIQGTGNNISFKVPKGFNRNFWQVFSKGKIKKKKSLSGDIVYFLPGISISSPNFKSEKDLINGVDWVGVQQTREFNESVVNEGKYKVGDIITVTRKDGKLYKGKVEKLNPLKLRTGPSDVIVIPNNYVKSVSINESVNEGIQLTDIVALANAQDKGNLDTSKLKKPFNVLTKTGIIKVTPFSKTTMEKGHFVTHTYFKVAGKEFIRLSGVVKLLNITENINESKKPQQPVNRWLELKNDDTMHAHKKMAMGLKELKYQLGETQKFLNGIIR